MRLSDEQYEFIKGEVVALFERYDVRCIPISGFELAYKMGVFRHPLLGSDGKATVSRNEGQHRWFLHGGSIWQRPYLLQ